MLAGWRIQILHKRREALVYLSRSVLIGPSAEYVIKEAMVWNGLFVWCRAGMQRVKGDFCMGSLFVFAFFFFLHG